MPTSVLRKQAQPGGRKRSARAVNGGPDGRRERQASGQGYSRAAAYFPESSGSMSEDPADELLTAPGIDSELTVGLRSQDLHMRVPGVLV